MPDIERKTVSASQVPALFGVSPYMSRWMLWNEFRTRAPMLDDRDDTMDWGTLLQEPILAWVARELRLGVAGHSDYLRHPTLPIGCTPDGWVVDPIEGLGTVEAKAVNQWSPQEYHDGQCPLHVELQVQTQLMVPHPTLGPPRWGVIAATLGGTPPQLWRRKSDPVVQAQIVERAGAFLADVAAFREPPVDGRDEEIGPLLARYPSKPPAEVLWIEQPENAATLASLRHWMEQEKIAKAMKEDLRAKALELARGAQVVNVPSMIAPGPTGVSGIPAGGFVCKINRIPVAELLQGIPPAARVMLGQGRELVAKVRSALFLEQRDIAEQALGDLDKAMVDIAQCTAVARKASVQMRISFKDAGGLQAPGGPIDPGPMEAE